MNKAAFFAQLERELASLSPADRERSLGYFEEMIDDRIEEGLSEEAGCRSSASRATPSRGSRRGRTSA